MALPWIAGVAPYRDGMTYATGAAASGPTGTGGATTMASQEGGACAKVGWSDMGRGRV
jgi:hypothetical protein